MDELVHQLMTILRGMWHRRWIGLAAAWIVGIVAVTVALRIPDRYEATARVYVDTQTLLKPLMEGLSIQPNLEQPPGAAACVRLGPIAPSGAAAPWRQRRQR